MARRRKQERRDEHLVAFKVRLPLDIYERIAAKAKDETGKTMTRTIIDELAEYPRLKEADQDREDQRDLKVVLARSSAALTVYGLYPELRKAAAAVTKTDGSPQKAALDRLRTILNLMAKHEREAEEISQ
jgi:hypothetical protein